MPFCPKCRFEYVEGIETCPDCDLKLVPKLHEPTPDPYMDEELITVGSYRSSIEAREARLRLEGLGIESMIADEIVSQTIPYLSIMGSGIRVMVRESDVDAARKALNG